MNRKLWIVLMQQIKIFIFIINAAQIQREGVYIVHGLCGSWGVASSQGCREQQNEKLGYHRMAGGIAFLQSNKGAVNMGALAWRTHSQAGGKWNAQAPNTNSWSVQHLEGTLCLSPTLLEKPCQKGILFTNRQESLTRNVSPHGNYLKH